MKLFVYILLSSIAIMGLSVYIGAELARNGIALDCLRLGAFEHRGQFYSCELVEKNYNESEDFK